jgi:hypothetical protein
MISPDFLGRLWIGEGRMFTYLARLLWVIIRLAIVGPLFDLAINLAHWQDSIRLISVLVLLGAVGLLGWALWDLSNVLYGLGLKRFFILAAIMAGLMFVYRVWMEPDDRSLFQRSLEEMADLGQLIGDETISGASAIIQIPGEFLTAYQGGHKTHKLPPGFPTPDPEATPIQAIVIANSNIKRLETEETPVPPETSAVKYLIIGKNARVANTGGVTLRVRAEPGLEQQIVERLAENTELLVLEGPVQADGYNWWKIKGDFGEGWCVDRWLEPIE